MATNHILKYELKLFAFLRSQGYPLNVFVNSFDNLTSRGILPLSCYTKFFVWNRKMVGELVELYKIDIKRIHALGTPQFDLLKEGADNNLQNSDELFHIIEREQYLLYTTGHYSLLPREPELVEYLIETIFKDPSFKDFRFVVRLHPMENFARWQKFETLRPGKVYVDYPWKQNPSDPNWAVPSDYEFKRLGRILRGAKVVFNVASTITLDCCVLDTPIINVNFGVDPTDDKVIKRYYRLDHYKDISQAGCASMVNSLDEVVRKTKDVIANPSYLREKRKYVAAHICNFQEVTSSQQLINALTSDVLTS